MIINGETMKLGYLGQNDDGPFTMKPRKGPWKPIPDPKMWDGRPKVFGIKLKGSPADYRFVK